MKELVKNAHINILITFQATGLKLKLINALYQGRLLIANDKMLNGIDLKPLCKCANTVNEIKQSIKMGMALSFNEKEFKQREQALLRYSDQKNAQRLVSLVFDRR